MGFSFDLQLRDAWPGKAKKMAAARNRGASGDGKKIKTSNKVPGDCTDDNTILYIEGTECMRVSLGCAPCNWCQGYPANLEASLTSHAAMHWTQPISG